MGAVGIRAVGPTHFSKPLLGSIQSSDTWQAVGASLHPVGVFVRLERGDRIHPGTSGARRADINTFRHQHAADAHRPEKPFVSGIDQHIHTPVVHGNGDHACGLTGVENKGRVRFFHQFANRRCILQRAGDIRSMIDNNNSGIGLNALGDLVRIDKSFGVCADTCDRDIMIPLEVIGRAQNTVVLHPRNDHVVARV